ncbi:hypothetical protein ASU35_12385 [Acetivibrio ethanolgignens]|uniref:Uncharacterized protein n=1 Tax=Acetivibrio ethanolgignens TaxID=290052 RepID=A0A0V8QDJ9_9FIRM|nr:hypothetical protein [Acetivibrio ethanolgignens]KSV58554.1 hypothetical protein ASU35_12385 [Acetivibrio ethanolgignens]
MKWKENKEFICENDEVFKVLFDSKKRAPFFDGQVTQKEKNYLVIWDMALNLQIVYDYSST